MYYQKQRIPVPQDLYGKVQEAWRDPKIGPAIRCSKSDLKSFLRRSALNGLSTESYLNFIQRQVDRYVAVRTLNETYSPEVRDSFINLLEEVIKYSEHYRKSGDRSASTFLGYINAELAHIKNGGYFWAASLGAAERLLKHLHRKSADVESLMQKIKGLEALSSLPK